MSDERDLTPEQEARVARLLADARVEEPMPPDVAARLDRVLAGLAGEPVAPPVQHHAPVVDLAARRRRRVRNLLAAAAAVVVAGVGIGQLVDAQDSDGDGGAGTAQHDTDAGGGSEDDGLRAEEAPSAAGHGEMTQEELEELGEPPRITTRSFANEVRRLQDHAGVRTDAASGLMNGTDLAARGTGFTCDAADFGSGKLMAVRYNGSPAVLAYRPPSGQTQSVELLQCGSAEVLRSTTIPLP